MDFLFEEDLHYSFVEYGGSCITHWSFLDEEKHPIDVERLCGRLFLIADHDEGKGVRHAHLKNSLGNRFHRLKCREVENLLTPAVICDVIRDYAGSPDLQLQPFEQEDYKSEPLGTFIDDTVLKGLKKPKGAKKLRSFQAPFGTIKDKLGFARRAISNIETPEDVSLEAKRLIKKIVSFIRENNP